MFEAMLETNPKVGFLITGSTLSFAWSNIEQIAPDGSSLLTRIACANLPSAMPPDAMRASITYLQPEHKVVFHLLQLSTASLGLSEYVF